MSPKMRIESALEMVLKSFESQSGPPILASAIRHAVLSGGARIRPQLCLAVAMACGNDDPKLAMGAGVALELLHCGSLVHDDLPCFDNALLRRGVPSVHAKYGERIAVLAGDALIVMAFESLVHAADQSLNRLAPVMRTIMQGVGTPNGIIAGQAWECEPKVSLRIYQQAKTGALFSAATAAGAIASGMDAQPWLAVGESLGEATQTLGKPVGKDEELDRPSATRQLGLDGAVEYFDDLVQRAIRSIPDCEGQDMLMKLVHQESERLVPNALYERHIKEFTKTSHKRASV